MKRRGDHFKCCDDMRASAFTWDPKQKGYAWLDHEYDEFWSEPIKLCPWCGVKVD
jgi:hypothetical protein